MRVLHTDTPKIFKLSSVGCMGNKEVAVAVPTASCDVKYVDSSSGGKNTIFVRTLTQSSRFMASTFGKVT